MSKRAYGEYTTRQRVTLDPASDGRTQQHFKAGCDVNNIIARFASTGSIDHVNYRKPVYGEAPTLTFFEALCNHRAAIAATPVAPDPPIVPPEAPQAPTAPSDAPAKPL